MNVFIQTIIWVFDLWLTLADPYMTFDPSNVLHFGQGFFLPNLVAIKGMSKQFDFWLTLADPCMTFDPSNAIMVAIRHF